MTYKIVVFSLMLIFYSLFRMGWGGVGWGGTWEGNLAETGMHASTQKHLGLEAGTTRVMS